MMSINNEFYIYFLKAVKLARQLLEQEEEESDGESTAKPTAMD